MKVKVCGITKIEQLQGLADTGAAFGGLIFYKKSPRYVLNHLKPEDIRTVSDIKKIGVFVNANPQEVIEIAEKADLFMVQLHGEESADDCKIISKHVPVMKAISVSEKTSFKDLSEYQDTVKMFLFDTKGEGYGGTGKKFNWKILDQYPIKKPYFLSGGIGYHDLNAVREFAKAHTGKNLFALDINSKFEITPGIKDLDLVKKFIQEINKEII